MANRKNDQPLKFRVFVGGVPWEELTEQQKEEFSQSAAERMGRALNDYYGQHPEEYAKI